MTRGGDLPNSFWTSVAAAFELGGLRSTSPVPGGLSNDLWRVARGSDAFAVKVMRANAESPEFEANIEAAYLVERAAFERGVPCPEPVPTPQGRCLVRVDGLWVRVHRWVEGDGVDPAGRFRDAATLLAAIHGAGTASDAELDDEPWDEAGWASLADTPGLPPRLADDLRHAAPAMARVEAATSAPGLRVPHAMSHGDLDPKNTLVVDGVLMALDWDAAGPQSCAREAVSLALDWTTGPDEFREALLAYAAGAGSTPVAEPWVFGGWVSAIGGWLVYNVLHRADSDLGLREAENALHRLTAFHRRLPDYLAAMP